MSDFRFYAACLASYNNGVLHGAWIDASTDKDEMWTQIAAMLRASKYPNVMVSCVECDGEGATREQNPCLICKGAKQVSSAEEWAIHGYDGNFPAFGETSDLKQIAAFMEIVDAAEDRGIDADIVADVIDHFGPDYLDTARSAIEEDYRGEFDSLEDYATDFCEECYGDKEIPEWCRNYIDYAAMGRDWKYSGDIFTIEKGGKLLVFFNR